ncbi:MAG: hypothetical protein WD317_10410 [Balneolaceae bacterium]
MKEKLRWCVAVIMLLPLSVQGQGVDIRVESPEEPTRWGSYQTSSSMDPDFIVDSPHQSPEWALLQRELLRVSSMAAEHYFEHYFDERGYLLTDLRWGANDGPDDAIENVNRWPQLYALGGSERILDMYKNVYEGHVRQMSEPLRTITGRTSNLSYTVDGMYHKEFLTRSDWMHISEALMVFNVMGLGDPYDIKFRHRVTRFAGFYMNEDPGALNYDPDHKIIRSQFNGSRGPLMRRATSVDWVGDASEIRNRYAAGHGEESYEEFLFHFKDYYDTVGDVPLNLLSTTLALNAYALTGEEKYRDWLLEYVDAWYDRMEANNWVIPSNIGLDGEIGGATEGKWYGGAYGWSFTVEQQNPPAQGLSDRERTRWPFTGFMNAYVLTGDDRYLEAWRNQHDVIYNAGKMVDGVYHTPRMYGNPEWSREGYTENDDWYSFRPYRAEDENMLQIYYLSMEHEDREHMESNPWLEFLEGSKPDYAVNAMRADIEDVKKRMKLLREDISASDMRLVDDPMDINPASISSLIRLMGGGLYESGPARRSPPFHTRLRYFDPDKRRPGIPDDVAALVERMTDERVTVSLVNLNPVDARPVIIQGGGYGEHQIMEVIHDGRGILIDASSFQVLLEPGSGARLEIRMNRFANKPTMDFPWF